MLFAYNYNDIKYTKHCTSFREYFTNNLKHVVIHCCKQIYFKKNQGVIMPVIFIQNIDHSVLRVLLYFNVNIFLFKVQLAMVKIR